MAHKEFVRLVAGSLPILDPVYEFGALQVEGQVGFADLRPLFPGKTYVGCDLRPGPGVDRVLDLHALDLPDESVGTALCVGTLEHVEDPHRAVAELFRVLRPGGVLAMSSVMNFHIHAHPNDYWRFTPEGLRSLLRPFAQSHVESAGREVFPHTVVGVGIKDATTDLAELRRLLAGWRRRFWSYKGRSWEMLLLQLTPPIVLDLVRKRGLR